MFLGEKIVVLLPTNFFVSYPVNSFICLVDKFVAPLVIANR